MCGMRCIYFDRRKIKTIFLVSLIVGLVYLLQHGQQFDEEAAVKPRLKINSKSLKVSSGLKACIVMLTRNKDASDVAKTLTEFEANFNSRYKYPYVFLNNELFTDEFKKLIRRKTRSLVEFGQIPAEQWSVPEWINEAKLNNSIKKNWFYSQL